MELYDFFTYDSSIYSAIKVLKWSYQKINVIKYFILSYFDVKYKILKDKYKISQTIHFFATVSNIFIYHTIGPASVKKYIAFQKRYVIT